MFDYHKFISTGKAKIGNGNILHMSSYRINSDGTITVYADYNSPGARGASQNYDTLGRCIHYQSGELYVYPGIENIYLHND